MTRIVPLLVFIVFAAMAVVMLLNRIDPQDSARFVNYPLPELKIHALGDTTKPLVIDEKTTVLNFFASWCAPCLKEHAELVALKKKFPHITFHGIAWNDSQKNIDAMLKEHGNPYDHVWGDSTGSAAIGLGLRGIPETFIVKRNRVIYHLSGPITAHMRTSEIEPFLEQN